MVVDLDAVRTFIAVADAGQFQRAATQASLTQQAVSKRVAALERALGVRLFTRTPRGAELTGEGRAFLPHARELLQVQARAVAAVGPARRPLRVDVIARRSAVGALLRDFHRAQPEVALEVVALVEAGEAFAALRDGTLDATFRALPERPAGLAHTRVLDEPLQLLIGPAHPLAGARSVRLRELAGHRIWMPGIVEGSEWAAFYAALAAEFGLEIDALGPNFGTDAMLESLAGSSTRRHLRGRAARHARPASHPRARPHARLPPLARLARRQPAPGDGGAARPPGHGGAGARHVDVQRVLKTSRQSSRDSPSSVKRHS